MASINKVIGGDTARYILNFHVHHIDGDKLNNDINNLAVMTRSAHSRLHAQARSKKE